MNHSLPADAAIHYRAIIVSYDDGEYYGVFYRNQNDDTKKHLSAFYLNLDSEHSSLYFDGVDKIDSKCAADFELKFLPQAEVREILEERLFDVIYGLKHLIKLAVLIEGKSFDLIVD
jgi:hypothetical protein